MMWFSVSRLVRRVSSNPVPNASMQLRTSFAAGEVAELSAMVRSSLIVRCVDAFDRGAVLGFLKRERVDEDGRVWKRRRQPLQLRQLSRGGCKSFLDRRHVEVLDRRRLRGSSDWVACGDYHRRLKSS